MSRLLWIMQGGGRSKRRSKMSKIEPGPDFEEDVQAGMPSSNRAVTYRWTELPTDVPMPLLERRRVIGEKAMISHVTLKKGCFVSTHAHPNEQFACILSGRLKFTLGDENAPHREEMTVHPGEILHLPSNVPHAAEALEDTVVLDIFSPPSTTTGIDREA